jgi:hypothetical protein
LQQEVRHNMKFIDCTFYFGTSKSKKVYFGITLIKLTTVLANGFI